jgi:hypothetical protein
MRQRIIALTSLLSGLGVMALVVSLQHDPLAWTSAARPTASDAKPTAVSQTAERTAHNPAAANSTSPVLELPEVRIESRISVPKAEKREAPESLEPCSEWRDIGPAYVDHGEPLGTRRVRNLC